MMALLQGNWIYFGIGACWTRTSESEDFFWQIVSPFHVTPVTSLPTSLFGCCVVWVVLVCLFLSQAAWRQRGLPRGTRHTIGM